MRSKLHDEGRSKGYHAKEMIQSSKSIVAFSNLHRLRIMHLKPFVHLILHFATCAGWVWYKCHYHYDKSILCLLKPAQTEDATIEPTCIFYNIFFCIFNLHRLRMLQLKLFVHLIQFHYVVSGTWRPQILFHFGQNLACIQELKNRRISNTNKILVSKDECSHLLSLKHRTEIKICEQNWHTEDVRAEVDYI